MIYKMQIPPFPVKSFDLLTTRQAKEIFKWYTDDIPARLDQLQKCIDADVNGTVQLTRGKDSLRPLWSWLVANIQLQELTESDLKESLDAVLYWVCNRIFCISICILSINHHPDCGCVTGTFCSIKKNHKKGFFMAFL